MQLVTTLVLLASTGASLAAQGGPAAARKLIGISTSAGYGIAEPASGRFLVYADGGGIHVLDPRTGKVTATIDRTTAAINGSYFAGLLSISASGKRLVFIANGESSAAGHVWSVELDSVSGKPVSPPHRVSIMPAEVARISDDGRWIALVTTDGAERGGPPVPRKLLVIPSDGGDERVLDTAGRIQTPHWTPDGKSIYYIRGRGKGPGLARISSAGGEPDSLAPAIAVIGITPDGRRIAYYPGAFGDRFPLRIADMAARELATIAVPPDEFYVALSRREPAALLGRHDRESTRFAAISLDNGKEAPYLPSGEYAGNPRLSPDGRHLAAVGFVDDSMRIVVFEAASRQRRVIRTAAEPDGRSLQWSPDGSRIAFLGLDPSLSRHELHVVEVGTSRAARLLEFGPTRASNAVLFRWRSDGQSIDYITGAGPHGPEAVLQRVTLSGEQSVVRKLPGLSHGVGTTGGYRLLNDSLIVLGRDYSRIKSDTAFLSILDTRTGAVRRLTDKIAYWNLSENHSVLSPDGKWIAFGSGGPKDGQTYPQWAIASLDGKTLRLLGEPMGCDAWPVTWLPDSRGLVAVGVPSCDPFNMEYHVTPIDGGPARRVAVPRNSGVTLAPDGKSLVVAATAGSASSIIILDLAKALGASARPASGRN